MAVKFFEEVIDSKWKLKKNGSNVIVYETHKLSKNKEIKIGGAPLVGFSLDKAGQDPFPIFNSGTAKKGMKSVCDAMVVTQYNGDTYFFSLDMKSKKGAGAFKQIESGRILFDWVMNLVMCHGHTSASFNTPKFFGIVSLPPRNQQRKTLSRRSADIPAPKDSHCKTYKVFTLPYHPSISIPKLIEALPK